MIYDKQMEIMHLTQQERFFMKNDAANSKAYFSFWAGLQE